MSIRKTGHPVTTGLKPKGILVVIEGMDGVGKSTLTTALEEALLEQGISVHRTREPTQGPFGKMLRERQASGVRYTPWEEYWLFMLDRVGHGQEIRQHLAQGCVVLSDRYWHSTWVYQVPRMVEPTNLAESEERRAILVREAEKVTPVPDLLVILDLSVEKALQRLVSRGALDAFETTELLTQYRADYQRLAEQQNGLLLSADRPIDTLVAELRERVLSLRENSVLVL